MNPAQVHFSGWLGSRVDANWKNRLATVSLDERLKPFVHPAESDGWSGEHIGKWLHAAALTWSYTHDPALRGRIDEAVAALARDQGPDGYLGTYAPDRRWGGWDVWTHKYNLIGLLACHEFLGDARALDVARRIGDLLVQDFRRWPPRHHRLGHARRHGRYQRVGADGAVVSRHGRSALPGLRPLYCPGLRSAQRPQDHRYAHRDPQRGQDGRSQGLRNDVQPGRPLRVISLDGRRGAAAALPLRVR